MAMSYDSIASSYLFSLDKTWPSYESKNTYIHIALPIIRIEGNGFFIAFNGFFIPHL